MDVAMIDALVKRMDGHEDRMLVMGVNRHRLAYAISVMEEVKRIGGQVDMTDWYSDSDELDRMPDSIAEFHACGNRACFAGWMSMSPLWVSLFGKYEAGGMEMARFLSGKERGEYTPVPYCVVNLASAFVFGYPVDGSEDVGDFSSFYQALWSDVTIDDVLEKLYYYQDVLEGMYV